MRNLPNGQRDEDDKRLVLTGFTAYGYATIAVLLSLGGRLLMDPVWGDRLPYGLFFLAVAILTQFVDVGASIYATIAGFFLGVWFFVEPRHSFVPATELDRFNGVCYFVICFGMIYFAWRTRQALLREQAAKNAMARLAAIIESSDDAIIGRDLAGSIVSWNGGAAKLYGYTEKEALGQPITFLMAPESGKELASLQEHVGQGQHISHFETVRRKKNGELVEVSLSISPVRNSAGKTVGTSTIARDISERRRAERERERLLADLQNVLGEVRTLSGLLPICAHCKKIRDDKGYWNQIELYIREHSGAKFTHSICPDCAEQNFKGFLDEAEGQHPPQKT